ncbi:MFS transporter [Singulisphaera sp. PoT]|uniref:MFS transporter n=1 Tax=Singulisphaera sp. PoT TaxID=3411797 RepID=UPI003BF5B30E
MSPLVVIMLIVLVDLLGFSIVMPLLAPFAKQYGLSGGQIGLLFAAYPMCQLIAGPILGRLSDRYGRRPLLIVSQAGTALSFVILALSSNFTVMLLGRMLDGFSGGNILVAQAYVADVTTKENRSKGMGLIGMAFGLGFVLGPFLGGLLVELPIDPAWRLKVPFLVAAVFSTIAWILVYFRLPESLVRGAEPVERARVASWRGLIDTVSLPSLGRLVVLGALVVLGFAALEGTYSLFLSNRLNWGPQKAAFGFAFLGLVSAIIQGGMIRRLVPKYGEPRLIVIGVATLTVGLGALALSFNVTTLLLATMIVGIGQGLASPTVSGLLSRLTPASEQGAVFGVLSMAQTLARMINYIVANELLAQYGPSAPFWEGSVIAFLGLVLAIVVAKTTVIPSKGVDSSTPVEEFADSSSLAS